MQFASASHDAAAADSALGELLGGVLEDSLRLNLRRIRPAAPDRGEARGDDDDRDRRLDRVDHGHGHDDPFYGDCDEWSESLGGSFRSVKSFASCSSRSTAGGDDPPPPPPSRLRRRLRRPPSRASSFDFDLDDYDDSMRLNLARLLPRRRRSDAGAGGGGGGGERRLQHAERRQRQSGGP